MSNGSPRIQLILPSERAQAFLNSVEHSLSQLDNSQVDISQLDVEKGLRNDEQSFNTVRRLLRENYHFRIVDAHGQDIHNRSETDINNGKTQSAFGSDDSWSRSRSIVQTSLFLNITRGIFSKFRDKFDSLCANFDSYSSS